MSNLGEISTVIAYLNESPSLPPLRNVLHKLKVLPGILIKELHVRYFLLYNNKYTYY